MKPSMRTLCGLFTSMSLAGGAIAQDVPASPAPAVAAPTPPAAGAPAARKAPATPAARSVKSTAQSEAGEPRAGTGRKAAAAADRVDLNTATVTGDREQPKVMYVVPWKSSDIGDGSGKPLNSLLDEALAPVDRDEFKREVVYYGAVQSSADQKGEK